MSKKKDNYQNRLRQMKESIDNNKGILTSDFPDDVTIIGNPDLLKKSDDEIESDNSEE